MNTLTKIPGFLDTLFAFVLFMSPMAIHSTPTPHIRHLIAYHHQQYLRDLQAAVEPAYEYLQGHPYRLYLFKPPAVVFDIDETLLSNWPALVHSDFQYHATAWNAWIIQAHDLGIQATIRLYHALQKRGYAIILLTGRHASQREETIQNLHQAGLYQWRQLIMRTPAQRHTNACHYKAEERSKLYRFYRIVMNVGDQMSDFCGRFNGLTIKLPNPFYTIPSQDHPHP